MILAGRMRRAWRALMADERGASLAELLISFPLLAGVMLIATNYGVALSQRDALAAATWEAARFVGRAPAELRPDADGRLAPHLHAHFLAEARLMIAERMDVAAEAVALAHRVELVPGSERLREPFWLVTLEAEVAVDRPLGPDMPMRAVGTGRSLSLVEPGGWAACDRDGGCG